VLLRRVIVCAAAEDVMLSAAAKSVIDLLMIDAECFFFHAHSGVSCEREKKKKRERTHTQKNWNSWRRKKKKEKKKSDSMVGKQSDAKTKLIYKGCPDLRDCSTHHLQFASPVSSHSFSGAPSASLFFQPNG
jgi:hypothetical protein